jgi:FkbM family methyltransferase
MNNVTFTLATARPSSHTAGMGFFDRLATSIQWRARLWAWGNRLRVGSKQIHRDPTLISPYVAKVMALGRYEKPERDLVAYMHEHGLLRRGDRVIEAGGGLGAITMQIADIVGDDAIFAFEPNPRTCQALRANLALNGHSVTVENAALVADDRNEVRFVDTIDTSSFAVAGTLGAAAADHAITVRAEPLARLMARLDPTVLVLDVEGAECELIGSVDEWGRIRAIHLEYHPEVLEPGQLDAMFAHLRRSGFASQSIPDFGSHLALLVRQSSLS